MQACQCGYSMWCCVGMRQRRLVKSLGEALWCQDRLTRWVLLSSYLCVWYVVCTVIYLVYSNTFILMSITLIHLSDSILSSLNPGFAGWSGFLIDRDSILSNIFDAVKTQQKLCIPTYLNNVVCVVRKSAVSLFVLVLEKTHLSTNMGAPAAPARHTVISVVHYRWSIHLIIIMLQINWIDVILLCSSWWLP